MNNDNLIPNEKRTPKERSENARKAGIASGKARRYKKTLRELFEEIFDESPEAKKKLAYDILLEASEGKNKTRAFEVIRDTIGEKPIEKVEVEGDTNLNININVRE